MTTRASPTPATTRGEATRRRVLDAALGLFRARGFDATTMRDVADAAGLSLGAAYYYFPAKDALVLAYYDSVQAAHDARVREAAGRDLRDRVATALRTKFEVVREDRALLGVLFRYVGDPDHPLSPLGPHTHAQRAQSVATFARALGDADVPAALRPLAAEALWALHLALLVYFLYDRSPDQARTFRLADGAADLVRQALALASAPGAEALLAPLLATLADAGLVPDAPPATTAATRPRRRR